MTQRKILRRAASRSVPAAFCVILLVAFLSPSEGVGKVDDNAVVMPLGADVGAAYDIRRTGNTEQDVVAVHPRQDLRFEFRGASVALSPRMGDRWQVELAYAGHGRADRAFAYAEPRAQHADGHRVELDRGPGLTEWYLHLPEGLEQGFTLRERPEGPSEVELVVAIDVVGELTPELGRGGAMVVLRDFSGRARLRYAGLVAFDSSGRELPARMEVHARRILLRVDDRGARYPVIIDPLLFENKVVGSDTTAGDSFGHAVAVDGSYAVVGAPGHDPGAGSFEGVVYFYKRSGESWVNRGSGSCQLSDAGCDAFGSAVDLEGEWGVVGAPGLGGTTTSGRVVLYRLSGGLFIRHSVLTLPAAAVNELFGASVSIAFPYLVVGAPGDDEEGTNAGAVYLYWFLNDAWVQFAKLTASDGGPFDGFGRAVAIDEDTFVVGAPGHDGVGTDTGAVYTFTRGAVLWFEDDDVLLPAPDMNNGAAFGRALAILDNRLLVGVWQDSRVASNGGRASLYSRTVSDRWNFLEDFAASPVEENARFGTAVALEAGTAVVGSRAAFFGAGSVHLFVEDAGTWAEAEVLTAPDAHVDQRFGVAVDVERDLLLVGAERDNEVGVEAGAIYFYSLPLFADGFESGDTGAWSVSVP